VIKLERLAADRRLSEQMTADVVTTLLAREFYTLMALPRNMQL